MARVPSELPPLLVPAMTRKSTLLQGIDSNRGSLAPSSSIDSGRHLSITSVEKDRIVAVAAKPPRHSAYFMLGPIDSEDDLDIESGNSRPVSRLESLQRERSRLIRSTYTPLNAALTVETGPETDDKLQ
jgi:hypothetical protein